MIEIIKTSNPNVISFEIFHDEKIIDLSIKKDSVSNINDDIEIQNILSEYRNKKYKIGIFVSGKEDFKNNISNILAYEVNKLVMANARA